MSSEYYEHVMEERAAAEFAEWERTDEGQAWRREHEKARSAIEWANIRHEKEQMAAHRARLERERHWQEDNPVEWSAWKRLQVVLCQDIQFDLSETEQYGFEAFLAEVKPAPPGATRIEQMDDRFPFRPGNLRWTPGVRDGAATVVEPEYLTLQEVAHRSGFSYDFVYDAVRNGDLVAVQKGRQWRVKPSDYRAWMDRGRAASTTPSRPDLKQTVSHHFPKRAR